MVSDFALEQPTPVASSRVKSSRRTLIENWTISQLWLLNSQLPTEPLLILAEYNSVQKYINAAQWCWRELQVKSSLPGWALIGNLTISKDPLYLDCFFESEMKAQKGEFLEIFEYLRLLDSSLACATSPFNLVIKV